MPRSTSSPFARWRCRGRVTRHEHSPQAAEDYLAVRRALGFKLVECEKQLANFIAYMEGADASTVTTELALTWATRPTSATPAWWSERLIMVRGFARHLQAIDPATEVASRRPAAPPTASRQSPPVLRCRDRRADGRRPGVALAAAGRHL